MQYPYIFLGTDGCLLTKGEWCLRIDEGSSYDGYTLEEAAKLVYEMNDSKGD